MIDMQRAQDSVKMLFGSFLSVSGGLWSALGNNHQSIGAACAILGAIYATVYFVAWIRGKK